MTWYLQLNPHGISFWDRYVHADCEVHERRATSPYPKTMVTPGLQRERERIASIRPLTWDGVKAAMAAASPAGMTNRQIATAFNVHPQEVAALTRMMWKAGEIGRDEPPTASHAVVYFHRP